MSVCVLRVLNFVFIRIQITVKYIRMHSRCHQTELKFLKPKFTTPIPQKKETKKKHPDNTINTYHWWISNHIWVSSLLLVQYFEMNQMGIYGQTFLHSDSYSLGPLVCFHQAEYIFSLIVSRCFQRVTENEWIAWSLNVSEKLLNDARHKAQLHFQQSYGEVRHIHI